MAMAQEGGGGAGLAQVFLDRRSQAVQPRKLKLEGLVLEGVVKKQLFHLAAAPQGAADFAEDAQH